jgi:hypothetical protein
VPDCIQRVIADLQNGDASDIRKRLLEATLLIEKSRGLPCYRGVSPVVDAAEITPEKITELRAALIHFAQRHREHADVGSALWALGKLHDGSLRTFFLNEMRHHLQAHRHHPVSQADCALEELGDGVDYNYAPGERSHEQYFRAVRAYLETRGA